MALETLQDTEEINGEKVKEVFSLLDYLSSEEKIASIVHDNMNCLFFKIQDGPVKEVGVNGCQVEDIVAVAHHIVTKLNEKFPCKENEMMIEHLQAAISCSKARTRNRLARDVEGLSKA